MKKIYISLGIILGIIIFIFILIYLGIAMRIIKLPETCQMSSIDTSDCQFDYKHWTEIRVEWKGSSLRLPPNSSIQTTTVIPSAETLQAIWNQSSKISQELGINLINACAIDRIDLGELLPNEMNMHLKSPPNLSFQADMPANVEKLIQSAELKCGQITVRKIPPHPIIY